ncbi:MAG: hypothetical protein ACYS5F_14620, partial [Planctomycetota bacterium]
LGAPVEQTDAARLQDVTGGGTGGFYGITVAHSDDSAVHRGINTLKFNVESFYITQNPPNTDESLVNFRESPEERAITVERPLSTDDITFFFTTPAITIKNMFGVLRGTSSPAVDFYIKHDPDRSAEGLSLTGANSGPLTSTTTPQSFALTGDINVPANSWMWLENSATEGDVEEMSITLIFTED